jgi:hypothetical protein
MKTYITTTSISEWAMLNALWSAIRDHQYVPKRIYMFITEGREDEAAKAKRYFTPLLKEYGVHPDIIEKRISEEEVQPMIAEVGAIIKSERGQGNEIAIDITSGRKALVTGALMVGWKNDVDHIFYLYLKDLEHANNPYMMIPLSIQHPHDFVKEVREHA